MVEGLTREDPELARTVLIIEQDNDLTIDEYVQSLPDDIVHAD